MGHLIFYILFAIAFGFVLFGLFTRRGRNLGIKVLFGEVIKDLGIIAENKIPGGNQKLKLLECQKDGVQFYVIEVSQGMPGAYEVFWVKVDDQTLETINSLTDKT